MRRRMLAATITALLSTPLTAPFANTAAADPTMVGDPEAGFLFARQACAECHLVEPDWTGSLGTKAKPFPDIAADPKTTELSLKVFLRSPHIAMPNFVLTEEETENVVAYLLSLKPERQD